MRQITLLKDFAVHKAGATISIDSMTASSLVSRGIAEYAAKTDQSVAVATTEPGAEQNTEAHTENIASLKEETVSDFEKLQPADNSEKTSKPKRSYQKKK